MDIVTDLEGSTLPPSTPGKSVPTSIEVKGKSRTTTWPDGVLQGKKNMFVVPKDAFVTIHADKGKHRSRFRILPYSRSLNPKFSGRFDKLSQYIQKGGGLVVEGTEEILSNQVPKDDVIKILDLEFVRANIPGTQDMLIPYDCFSSSFIWNQILQRSNSDREKRDADLNLYRVSPSALVSYDARGIFQGTISWDDIPSIHSDKLSPAIRIKEVAMQMFPEMIIFPEGNSKTRRFYPRNEGQALLDKICELDAHDRAFGIRLYQELAETCFEDRTSLSLKEHFRKTVLPHILENDNYYTVAPDDLEKFRMASDKDGRAMLKDKKKKAREEADIGCRSGGMRCKKRKMFN